MFCMLSLCVYVFVCVLYENISCGTLHEKLLLMFKDY